MNRQNNIQYLFDQKLIAEATFKQLSLVDSKLDYVQYAREIIEYEMKSGHFGAIERSMAAFSCFLPEVGCEQCSKNSKICEEHRNHDTLKKVSKYSQPGYKIRIENQNFSVFRNFL